VGVAVGNVVVPARAVASVVLLLQERIWVGAPAHRLGRLDGVRTLVDLVGVGGKGNCRPLLVDAESSILGVLRGAEVSVRGRGSNGQQRQGQDHGHECHQRRQRHDRRLPLSIARWSFSQHDESFRGGVGVGSVGAYIEMMWKDGVDCSKFGRTEDGMASMSERGMGKPGR
jgi:hypothetical protein